MVQSRAFALFAWLAVGAITTSCSDAEQHDVDLCGADAGALCNPATGPLPHAHWPDPLAELPRGERQTQAVCKRVGNDRIGDLFCGDKPTPITSLKELQEAFDFSVDQLGGLHGATVAGHSTALSARSVSAINPRAIFLRLEAAPDSDLNLNGPVLMDMFAMAFVRGEQFVELILRDRDSRQLQFYVIGFEQACNDSAEGCGPGDLLTPAIERDWTELTVYDEESLRNTVMDCAPCHQPMGPGTPKVIRMQELQTPWSHWFSSGTEGGKALMADYHAAKGEEPYAGLGPAGLMTSNPINLTQLTYFSKSFQPSVFPSVDIEAEVKQSAGGQPLDNSTPGQSDTWRDLYNASLRGEVIPVPYHDVKVTDPDKLAAMTQAYTAFREGELPADELPDIRDIYPDDPELLAHMGMMTEPGLDGEGVLMQACGMCHNERLDQRLSRANFRADLDGLDRKAKDRAIERLMLPPTDPRAMPPARLRTLSRDAREQAIEALRN